MAKHFLQYSLLAQLLAVTTAAMTALVGGVVPAQAQSAIVNVWNITPVIGHNPDASIADVSGITGPVATTANSVAIATTIDNTTHPEGPCGLVYWNPATNFFKVYTSYALARGGIEVRQKGPAGLKLERWLTDGDAQRVTCQDKKGDS